MVGGLDRLQRRLTRTIPAHVREAVAAVMEENAQALVAEMRRLVPVDKGDLRDSIGWTWGEAPAGTMVLGKVGGGARRKSAQGAEYQTMRITVYAGGGDAFHAWFQEFGTAKMPANPFFFPSYRKLKRSMKARTTRAIKKAVQAGATAG